MGVIWGIVYVYLEILKVLLDLVFCLLLGGGFIGLLLVLVFILIGFFLLVWIFFKCIILGCVIVVIGGNEEIVRLVGINVKVYIMLVYVSLGFFVGIVGILLVLCFGIV